MQFRKISDTKIHCVISKEEMWEKGIGIDDFLDHREKTEEFLREVLAEARYELDLKDMGPFFSVQMSVMPEGDVSLVISGEQTEGVYGALEEFGKRLQDFREVMKEAQKQLEKKAEEKKETKAETKSSVSTEVKSATEATVLDIPLWLRFSNMEQCIFVAKQLAAKSKMDSALYKYKDAYYLQLVFRQEEHEVAGTILVASEYATEIITHEQGGVLLLEHATKILKEDAIETLASL